MFALYNTKTEKVVQGPWRQIPNPLDLTGLVIDIIPAKVDDDGKELKPARPNSLVKVGPVDLGFTRDDYKVVEFVMVGERLSPYHTEISKSQELVGNTLTITRVFQETISIQAGEIEAEAERRINERYPLKQQLNRAHRRMDFIEMKQDGQVLTDADNAQYDKIISMLAWIRKIRVKAKELEATAKFDFQYDDKWNV